MTVISVVIPALNDSVMLRSCLAALAAQSRPADEIIVVDNGSTDDTAEVARAAGATVITELQRGIPAATATGLDAARGDILARLDADSVPPPDWIARIDSRFQVDLDLAALTGAGDFYGGNRFVCWVGETLYIGGYFWFVGWMLGHPPLFGSNYAMRASAWARIRDTSHRNVRELHDDLDLSYQFAPDMTIAYDPNLRVGVSARPFGSLRGFARRIRWAYTTIAVNSQEQTFFGHRGARHNWVRNSRGAVAAAQARAAEYRSDEYRPEDYGPELEQHT